MEHTTLFCSAVFLLILNTYLTLTSSKPLFNSTTDEYTLFAFKNSLTSNSNGVLSNYWSTNTSICSWIGVSCSPKHHRVTALNISGFGLGGTITPHLGNLTFLRSLDISFNNFRGFIPSELSNLHRLTEINVGVNSLTGGIPSWFGGLSQLQYIYLNNNTFSGSIPNGIFNMPSLIEINMRYNRLSGKLPNDMCSSATTKLKRIYLSGNQLSSEIPANIYKCRELEDVRLPMNHFNGSIPTQIGSLTKLKILSLWSNQFTGRIPEQVGNFTFLEQLSLASNSLSGNIPSSIFNISTLQILNLRKNMLSGSIPILYYLPKLEELYLDHNNFTGGIPSDICSKLSDIKVLYLWANQLSGKIPTNIGECKVLEDLELSSNHFSDSIPRQIGNLTMLRMLFLYGNNFNGNIPSSIFNIFTLKIAHLGNNMLSGSIPILYYLPKFEELYLYSNKFTGEIPSDICSKLPDIKVLYLWGNQLSGNIQTNIGECKAHEDLELANNHFSGSIPRQIGNLTMLRRLLLGFNNFRGHVAVDCFNDEYKKKLAAKSATANPGKNQQTEKQWIPRRNLESETVNEPSVEDGLRAAKGKDKIIEEEFVGKDGGMNDVAEALLSIKDNNVSDAPIQEQIGTSSEGLGTLLIDPINEFEVHENAFEKLNLLDDGDNEDIMCDNEELCDKLDSNSFDFMSPLHESIEDKIQEGRKAKSVDGRASEAKVRNDKKKKQQFTKKSPLVMQTRRGTVFTTEVYKSYPGLRFNKKAELTAIIEGLKICLRLGLKKIWIEVDASTVLQMIRNNGKGSWRYQQLFADFMRLKEGLELRLSHIHREGNQPADFLANYAVKKQQELIFLNCIECKNLRGFLVADAWGLPSFRFNKC